MRIPMAQNAKTATTDQKNTGCSFEPFIVLPSSRLVRAAIVVLGAICVAIMPRLAVRYQPVTFVVNAYAAKSLNILFRQIPYC